MKKVVWGLVVLLIVLHQDIWFWENDTLVFGFMPITLLYHAGISLAAGVTWFLATKHAWPAILEDDSHSIPQNTEEAVVATGGSEGGSQV